MDIIHLLLQKLEGKNIAGIVAILPDFVLLLYTLPFPLQDIQNLCVLLRLKLAVNLPRREFLEITHHIR